MNSTEIQEKLNAYNDKKQSLKTKAWFRVVQVIYALGAILAEGFVILLTYSLDSNQSSVFVWGTVIVFIIFWIIKKVGYYIMIGDLKIIKPDFEHTLEAKLKKHE